jgi:hypothetical protein
MLNQSGKTETKTESKPKAAKAATPKSAKTTAEKKPKSKKAAE